MIAINNYVQFCVRSALLIVVIAISIVITPFCGINVVYPSWFMWFILIFKIYFRPFQHVVKKLNEPLRPRRKGEGDTKAQKELPKIT